MTTAWVRRAAAVAALAAASGCASRTAARSRGPAPFPLSSPEPHVEPDLVGTVHVVRRGETLYRIARTYGVPIRELMEVNDLADPRLLEPGMELFVPGAPRALEVPPLPPGAIPEPEPGVQAARPSEREPDLPRRDDGSRTADAAPPSSTAGPATPVDREIEVAPVRPGGLRWPVKGVLYSRYGVRQGQRHDGIDIAAPEGSPIAAAAPGEVVYAGAQSGYGSIVILRHDRGLLTLYAHASKLLVRQGERVGAGQPIAKVGRSGRTTGPHLHFEVREGTRPRNPLFYLD